MKTGAEPRFVWYNRLEGKATTKHGKLVRNLNKELKATGCITIAGRIDRKFFYEKFYSTKSNTKGD